jgi:hypothetical protein
VDGSIYLDTGMTFELDSPKYEEKILIIRQLLSVLSFVAMTQHFLAVVTEYCIPFANRISNLVLLTQIFTV